MPETTFPVLGNFYQQNMAKDNNYQLSLTSNLEPKIGQYIDEYTSLKQDNPSYAKLGQGIEENWLESFKINKQLSYIH